MLSLLMTKVLSTCNSLDLSQVPLLCVKLLPDTRGR